MVVSLELAVTLRLVDGVSGSLTVNRMFVVGTSSLVVCGSMLEMVGGSFTGLTVSVKVLLELKLPSDTMIVIAADPNRFVAGRIETVRELPLPLKPMFEFGTSVWFAELADSVREPVGVSTSPIVKVKFVEVSSGIVVFGGPEIVGASFTAETLMANCMVLDAPSPSVTVTVIVVVLEPNWFAADVIVSVRFVPEPPGTMFPFGISP